jgi:hypothetical protein
MQRRPKLWSNRMHQSADSAALIDAAAAMLALPIEPEWKPEITAHLAVLLQLALSVAEFELADEAEPAPIFEA